MAKLKYSCGNDIKINLKEAGWEGVYWIDLAQDGDRLAGSSEHANKPSGSMTGEFFLLSDYQLLKKESGPWS